MRTNLELFPYGPHHPELGPKVFETNNEYAGFAVHKQKFNFYRVIAWFLLEDKTVQYTCSTHFGKDNATDCGYHMITELTNAYWPANDTLTKTLRIDPPLNPNTVIPE